jgi:predicted O-methyltransferase YrrM
MLNVTRETGQLLALLVRATGARRVLEIGTSNGYSTIWLAEAALATGASVTTVERSADKARMAAGNFARGGLAPVIDLVQEDAAVVLSRLADASVDLLFLDAERAEYPGWWRDLTRVLRPGGLLVADNAVSHAGEMARFRELLSDDRRFTACIVPVGNGELLAVKGSPGDPEVLEE